MTDTTFVQGTIIEPTWLQDANDHVNDKAGIKHAASKISNVPSGNISATTVQAAIDELDSEKQPLNANLTALTTAASQVEMEAGTEVALRAMSPKLVLDAINYNTTNNNNLFINGDMRVQQRQAVTPSGSRQIGQVDRWAYQTGNGNMTGTTNSLGGVPVSSRQVLNTTVAFTASNAHIFDQRVEAKTCRAFGGKEITVSAYVWQNSGASQNWYWEVNKATAGEDNFSSTSNIATGASSPISVASSAVSDTGWVRVSFTFTPSAADCTNGLEFRIRSASTAGAVSSHNARLRDCQLEIGGTATTFAPKDFIIELITCIRYWEKSYDYDVLPGAISELGARTFINSTSPNASVGEFAFKVQKVKIPAFTCYSPVTGTVNKIRNENAGSDETPIVFGPALNGVLRIIGTTTSSATSFRFHFVVDAEL